MTAHPVEVTRGDAGWDVHVSDLDLRTHVDHLGDRVAAQQVLELIAQQPDVRPGGYDAADRDDQEEQG